jgi:arginine utilization protein RocB
MNSQEFRTAARTTFALAMDAYYAVSNDNDATMEQLIAADVAKTAADAQWIADQHTANTMAQAELDAATAKGCEEVVEVVAEVTTEVNTNEAFGTAWGADGQVLTYAETVEAIANRQGWFDTQGRWVNKAGWEKQHAHLSDWLTAKLTAN